MIAFLTEMKLWGGSVSRGSKDKNMKQLCSNCGATITASTKRCELCGKRFSESDKSRKRYDARYSTNDPITDPKGELVIYVIVIITIALFASLAVLFTT
jgi:uncharacterized membrane protein YvbJ